MGIKNLFRLIKEFAPNSIQSVPISNLRGWRVGVDISLAVYQWCAVGKSRNIVNADGKFINHIQGAFFRAAAMLSAGIIPVYIFDGKPPKIKDALIAQRRQRRENGDALQVPCGVYAEVKKLLEKMGLVTIQAPSEAEAQAAYYTSPEVRSLDAVATEDGDVLAFGARHMIRGLDTAAKFVTIIDRDKLLKDLDLSSDQFIDLCILLGCDYTGTLPGVGHKKALSLIKKYKNIERVLTEGKIKPAANFEFEAARQEFKKPLVAEDTVGAGVRKLSSGEIEELRNYLVGVHGVSAKRVTNSLSKLAVIYAG